MNEWQSELEEIAWRLVDWERSGLQLDGEAQVIVRHIERLLEIVETSKDTATRVYAAFALARQNSEGYPYFGETGEAVIKRLQLVLEREWEMSEDEEWLPDDPVLQDYLFVVITVLKRMRLGKFNREPDL